MTIEHDEKLKPNERYFHFNWAGMGVACKAMDQLGMLEDIIMPAWPKPEDHGLTSQQVWPDYDDELSGDAMHGFSPEVTAFTRLYEATRDQCVAKPTGIASYKFDSNDGWLVTPTELQAALTRWRCHDNVAQAAARLVFARTNRWDEWIAYLERAMVFGGFRVY